MTDQEVPNPVFQKKDENVVHVYRFESMKSYDEAMAMLHSIVHCLVSAKGELFSS